MQLALEYLLYFNNKFPFTRSTQCRWVGRSVLSCQWKVVRLLAVNVWHVISHSYMSWWLWYTTLEYHWGAKKSISVKRQLRLMCDVWHTVFKHAVILSMKLPTWSNASSACLNVNTCKPTKTITWFVILIASWYNFILTLIVWSCKISWRFY